MNHRAKLWVLILKSDPMKYVVTLRHRSQGLQSHDDMQAAETCHKNGATAVDIYDVDLADSSAVDGLAKHLLKRHTAIDVLVNNAGRLGRFPDTPMDGGPSVLYSDRRAVQAICRIDRGADQNEGLQRTLGIPPSAVAGVQWWPAAEHAVDQAS